MKTCTLLILNNAKHQLRVSETDITVIFFSLINTIIFGTWFNVRKFKKIIKGRKNSLRTNLLETEDGNKRIVKFECGYHMVDCVFLEIVLGRFFFLLNFNIFWRISYIFIYIYLIWIIFHLTFYTIDIGSQSYILWKIHALRSCLSSRWLSKSGYKQELMALDLP